MKIGRRRLRVSLLACGVFVLADLVCGLVFRATVGSWQTASAEVVEALNRRFRIRHPYYHHDLVPRYDGLAPWGSSRYAVRTNSLGFRDFQAADVPLRGTRFRLLLIGDSFTEGVGVEYESTFAGLLTKRFAAKGIELLNAGVGSYAPAIYWKKIEFLLERRKLQFDAVIVFIDVSDLWDEEDYRISSAGVVTEEGEGDEGAPIEPARMDETRHWWARNSVVYYGLSHATEAVHQFLWPTRWTVDDIARGNDGLQRAGQHMSNLAALLRARSIPLTVVVYPYPQELLADDRDSLQLRYWRDWANRERAGFIELFSPFFAEADSLGVRTMIGRNFFAHDVHWNAAGHRIAADAFQARFALPPGAANFTRRP